MNDPDMVFHVNVSPLHPYIDALGALEEGLGPSLSLCPDRQRSTPLDVLCGQLLHGEKDTSLIAAFSQGMARLARARATHFPENLFADLDFVAVSLLEQARRYPCPAHYLRNICAQFVDLLALFGCHSSIHFRYIHDFLYGFDWARWVRKKPAERQGSGPFAPEFLHRLRRRGVELLALIAAGDCRYPRLPRGQTRNPFPFSRAPEDEVRLHRSLAADHLIPVSAWEGNCRPDWQRNYSILRRQRAEQLHLDTGRG